METLIAAIRSAVTDGASDEVRAIGATACRSILTVLEAKAGEPLALPSPPTNAPTAEAPTGNTAVNVPAQVAALVGSLRAMPADQLLDLAIARLRAALPPDATVPMAAPLRFQILPLEPLTRVHPQNRSTP